MGKVIILNGSPRAPKSNSKQYAEIFMKHCRIPAEYYNITKLNGNELCGKISEFSDILFVFPLYADGLPVTLLNFFKLLENNPPKNKPNVSVLVNCGFLEYQQNDTAVRMVMLFCRQNGYKMGSVLKIGGGEAILTTPFKFCVKNKIKKLARSIKKKQYRELAVTMPLSKKVFIKAAAKYWTEYGSKNGVTVEEMQTMKIESV